MDVREILFLMYIMDGYSFRNTIGIVKNETDYATMVLSKDLIEISFINSSKYAVHKILLHPKEFIIYRYNIKDQNGNLMKEYPIAFETNELFNTTKGIGKKDGIRLYWIEGDNKINVQQIKTSSKDPGRIDALFVKILNMEYVRYEIGPYNNEPNVKIQSRDFAEICNQANILKCTYLELTCDKNGITFKGILPDQNIGLVNYFVANPKEETKKASNMNEIDNLLNARAYARNVCSVNLNIIKEDLITVRIPIVTIKALSKIHNISPQGTYLKFYFSKGKPLKIESLIGTYGTYIICLRDAKM